MNHDARRYGGDEYAPQGYAPGDYAPQPIMRPAASQSAPVSAQGYSPPPVDVAPAAVAAASGAPVEGDEGSQVATLSRQYQAHDVSFRTLKFRKPSGLELRKFGYPIRQILNADGNRVESIEVNTVIAAKYIVALSQPPIPPSTLDQMEIEDADQCYGAIARFFLR